VSNTNNSVVITIKSQDTILDEGGIIAIMPYKMPPPQGNISKAIIQLPLTPEKQNKSKS
jgi:hypothetical protein